MLFQQLIYFSKIAEYQNVSRAAEVLYVSQPTLSRTIKQLEEELGCELFERRGKSLILTPSGKMLLERSREMLHLLHKTETDIRNMNRIQKPSVCIQLRCIAGLFYEFFPSYAASNPDIEFTVFQSDNEGIYNNEYDLFLYPSETIVDTSTTVTAFRENIFIAMSDTHPLAKKKDLHISDLSGYKFVHIAGNRIFNKISVNILNRNHIPDECRLYCDDMVAVRNLVRDQQYLSHIPEYTWQKKDLEGIVLRSVQDLSMTRYICLSLNGTRPESPEAAAFRDYMLRCIREKGLTL